MKKTVSVCMTAVMALSLLAGGAVQAYALSAETVEPVSAVAEENCISSSWKRASDPALTEKVRKVFDKAFDGLEGVSYTPVALLASRTTGFGTQYRILCKATVVVPGAQEEYVVVTLQHSWLSKAEILDIGDPLCLTNLDYEEGAVGKCEEFINADVVVYCDEDKQQQVRDFITEANRTLPLYKRMSAVEFSTEPLPRNGAGKLLRQ